MKISNYTLLNLINTLGVYEDRKMPQRISYAITRTMMNLSDEYRFYDKQLKKLLQTYDDYLVKDKDGNMTFDEHGVPIVTDEKRREFNGQVADLLNCEVDVDIYHIPFDTFDYENNDIFDALSPNDIMTLQSILCERKTPEKEG